MQAAAALSSWANKVSVRWSVKRDRVRKPRCVERICVSGTELDEYRVKKPRWLQLFTRSPKAIAKPAKRKPDDQEFGKDEQWFMVDSGAGTNGAKCKKFFLDYKIQDYPTNRPGPRCVAANGAPLENGGYVNLEL